MKKHTVISVAAAIAVAMSLSGCAGTFDELFDSSNESASEEDRLYGVWEQNNSPESAKVLLTI